MLRFGQYVKLETIEDLVQYSGYDLYDSSVIVDDNYRAIIKPNFYIDNLKQRNITHIMFVEYEDSFDGSYITGIVIDSSKTKGN